MKQVAEFFRKLLDTSDWPPRWHCGKWSEFHGWLYIVSDLLVWSAYFAIPLIIIRYISKKHDARFIRVYFLFAGFILACGATHFFDAVTFWYPVYRLNALVRAITGILSWTTVFYLIKVLPVAFTLRSSAELEAEVEQRKKAEEKFRNLLESAPDSMVIINEQGLIQLVNAQTVNMFGYTRQEMIGENVNRLMPMHYDDLKQVRDAGSNQKTEKEELTGKLKEIEKKSLRKKIIIAVAVLLLLVTGLFFYKQFFSHADFTSKEKSIAVLPFTNMGNDKDNEYFSSGMTDEIITQVSKIPSLKVISRTSVMQYKNSTKSLKQIAEELGVSFVLEGGVQKSGDSVKINAQLIDASSDGHIWAEIYERNIKEIFAIQSEVAQSIAAALKTKLTPEEKREISKHYTDNVDAYKFYRNFSFRILFKYIPVSCN